MKKCAIGLSKVMCFELALVAAALSGCSGSSTAPAIQGLAMTSAANVAATPTVTDSFAAAESNVSTQSAAQNVSVCIAGVPYNRVFTDNFSAFPNVSGYSGAWQTSYTWGRENPNANDSAYYIDDSVVNAATQSADGITSIEKTSNGLNLIASNTPHALLSQVDNQPYVSGAINSSKLFSQTYGYFSADIKLPSGKGIWPAFWLLPTVGYPPEIDIMEELGGDPMHVYETTHDVNFKVQQIESWMSSGVSGYHVYGVAWTSQTITYYIDGGNVGSVPNMSNQPMYMVLNLAVGNAASWPTAPDSATQFPAKMSVQWVHGYAQESGGC